MFLLFGTRGSAVILTIVHFACRICGVNAAQRVVRQQNKFTLFFVPLFSFSTSYEVECSNCGGVTDLTKHQAENAIEWAASSSSTA